MSADATGAPTREARTAEQIRAELDGIEREIVTAAESAHYFEVQMRLHRGTLGGLVARRARLCGELANLAPMPKYNITYTPADASRASLPEDSTNG
jgi:hypothetical protein